MSSDPLYFVRRGPLQYGQGNGRMMDLDQVLELEGLRNDEMLVRLGYLAMVNKGASIVQCGSCGSKFITDASLNRHGRIRHSDDRSTPIKDAKPASEAQIMRDLAQSTREGLAAARGIEAEHDNAAIREEGRLQMERPIYFENTTATRQSGDGPMPPEIHTGPVTAPKVRRRRRAHKRRRKVNAEPTE